MACGKMKHFCVLLSLSVFFNNGKFIINTLILRNTHLNNARHAFFGTDMSFVLFKRLGAIFLFL